MSALGAAAGGISAAPAPDPDPQTLPSDIAGDPPLVRGDARAQVMSERVADCDADEPACVMANAEAARLADCAKAEVAKRLSPRGQATGVRVRELSAIAFDVGAACANADFAQQGDARALFVAKHAAWREIILQWPNDLAALAQERRDLAAQ